MTPIRSRLAIAGVVAPPRSARPVPPRPTLSAEHCDARLDKLEAQFYDMADRRSYEAATEWWDPRWQAYHTSCVI